MQKFYRSEYPGEFVITNTVFKKGGKDQTREWVDNPIEVTSSSCRACCIMPHGIIKSPSLKQLQNHSGGLLGRNKMQLYAVNDSWKEMNADFSIVLTQPELDEIISEGYHIDNVVYTSGALCIANPGKFYLIPHGTLMVSPATALWLACFDGHTDIYMFGYDLTDADMKTIHAVTKVMQTYNDVTFHHVSDVNSPDSWRRCINFNMMPRAEFVSQCDI